MNDEILGVLLDRLDKLRNRNDISIKEVTFNSNEDDIKTMSIEVEYVEVVPKFTEV